MACPYFLYILLSVELHLIACISPPVKGAYFLCEPLCFLRVALCQFLFFSYTKLHRGITESHREQKKPLRFLKGFDLKSATTYSPTIAVPLALSGLTSLFGMGRGGTPTL